MELIAVGLFIIVATVAICKFWAVVTPYLYEFYIAEIGFEVRLFRLLTVYRIAFEDIVDVKVVELSEVMISVDPSDYFRTLGLPNRMFGKRVLLDKRKGFIRFLLVTPADAEAFAADIRRHISKEANT